MFINLTERVGYLTHSEDTDRPTLGYVRGDRHVLMIDAGNSAAHVQLFNSELQSRGLPLPDMVALTHWHWDHTFGLAFVDAVSFSSRLTNEQLSSMLSWTWDDPSMDARVVSGWDSAFCNEMIRAEYPNRDEIVISTADVVFDDRLTLDLGGVTCEMTRKRCPHSEDSVLVHVCKEGVLFLGDALCGDGHGWIKDGPQRERELLDALKALEFSLAVVGHAEHATKAELIAELEEELGEL